MRYFCIGDSDMVLGFKSAGVEGVVADSPADAAKAFLKAVTAKDVAIVIIAENVADMIRDKVDTLLNSSDFPLVLEVPGFGGPGEKRKDITDIIRQAVGIKI